MPSLKQTHSSGQPCFLGFYRRNNDRLRGPNLAKWFMVGTLLLVSPQAFAESLRLPTAFGFDGFDRERDANANDKAPSKTDGVYGRFDGPLSLQPFIGGAYTFAGPVTELGVAVYFLHTVGVQGKYVDGRLMPLSGRAPLSISTVSLALRPLFLLRWSKNLEQGPSLLDLTVDSLTLKIGGFWAEFEHDPDSKRGFESELSLGVPLLAKADGPWLTFAVVDRLPKVAHEGRSVDLSLSARFEWSFSLGQ
jgi:hypothetical protein